LERIADKADGRLDPVIAALDRAAVEAGEARALLDKASSSIELDPAALERAEERLFALRATARKHGVEVDDLVELRADLARDLEALDAGSEAADRLAKAESAAKAVYEQAARILTKARRAAAVALDQAVAGELPPLKLDKATFRTKIERLQEADWSSEGADRVVFEVSTNPGLPPGPLAKIASGGEMARFMLALKVVLARTSPVPTIVFDEVDSGIGGAVAAAVGERLARLAAEMQVLVVTHSPQVAARGLHHWRVAKHTSANGTVTRIAQLAPVDRREEIARMLAGSKITEQARAAAESLLSGAG
jgi:DNA repair protein RecN (Recombination protein N)